MTKFSQLIDDVADEQNHSLASVLMRAKVLAARLNSPSFRDWVNKELDGYDAAEEVPKYRKLACRFLGDFWGPFGAKVLNVPLLTKGLHADAREHFETQWLGQNIGAIEALLNSESETFHRHSTVDEIEYLRNAPGTRVEHHVLQSAQNIFTKSSVRGVLQAIRTRLLEILLKLREQYPELEAKEVAVSEVSSKVVGEVVQNVVYNQCTVVGDSGMANNAINSARDIKVGRDLVQAASITDSFKRIEVASVDSDLKALLAKLMELVVELGSRLPDAIAEQLAEDGKSFVIEATKANPRRTMLQGIGDTVTAVVKTLGPVAVPLTEAVNNIIRMFPAT